MEAIRPTRSPACPKALLWLAVVGLLALPPAVSAQSITGWLELSTWTPESGELLELEAYLNIGDGSERLGAYEAKLTWDPTILQAAEVADGRDPKLGAGPQHHLTEDELVFSNFNVEGVTGKVSLIKVRFSVAEGGSVQEAGLALAFPVLAAAESFVDLLPQLEIQETRIAAIQGESWGSVKARQQR